VYKRPLLSVCMIARDEERWIGRALASVAEVADDLVVVDTGSADATAAIAQAHGARVFHIPWEGDFAKARNHALERARGQWILVLDADEYLHPEDKNKLRKLVQRAPVDVAAFTVTELNLASENPEDVQDQFSPIRLFRNTPYHRFRGRVHEQIAATLRGRLSVSDVRILHTGYLADVVETKQKPRRNVSLLLKALDEINSEDLHRYYLETQLVSEYTRSNTTRKLSTDSARWWAIP
jgi:glycosyltransferase involved in cell wall biosynthesis